MKNLTGTRVFVAWVVWAVLLGALNRLTANVGIALPIPTSVAVLLSKFLGPILLLLFVAPPLALTLVWWRRTRRPSAAPG